jgi:hypothetical protein
MTNHRDRFAAAALRLALVAAAQTYALAKIGGLIVAFFASPSEGWGF